jgi:hypothetical protein
VFQYPKHLWSLPCRYHNGNAARIVNDTPFIISVQLAQLQVSDCNTDILGVQPLSEMLLKQLKLRQGGAYDRHE